MLKSYRELKVWEKSYTLFIQVFVFIGFEIEIEIERHDTRT